MSNKHSEFKKELEGLINRYSMESESNTPDFILADFLKNCLSAFNVAVCARSSWYGDHTTISSGRPLEIGKEAGWAKDADAPNYKADECTAPDCECDEKSGCKAEQQ